MHLKSGSCNIFCESSHRPHAAHTLSVSLRHTIQLTVKKHYPFISDFSLVHLWQWPDFDFLDPDSTCFQHPE